MPSEFLIRGSINLSRDRPATFLAFAREKERERKRKKEKEIVKRDIMKDFMMIWNRLTGRRYSNVNPSQNQNDINEAEDATISRRANELRRKSSIVVNNIFNAALSVQTGGRPKWFKSK